MVVCTLADTPWNHSNSLHRQDAYVLGRLLTHEFTHAGNVGDTLKVYEEVRLPFANNIVQRSQDVGRYCGLSACAASLYTVFRKN